MQEPAMKRDKPSQLSEIELEIQHILDSLPFAVLLVDSDHHIVSANKAMKQEFGMDENQLIGAYCPMIVHQSSMPVVDCPLAEALEKGHAVQKEIFDAEKRRWMNAAVYPTPMATRDGKTVYLHFVQDITELKNTASELSKSLEHHRALCNLLQDLQQCQNCRKILEALINQIISLSWLGMAASAVGFLSNGKRLDLVAHCNVSAALLKRCRSLTSGECLCGKAAESGRTIVCSSNSRDHSIRYEGMVEHQHVVLPIKHKDHMLGVLALYLNPGDRMDDFRLRFLEAAVAAAGAALDAQLAREEVLRTQEKYISQVISSQEDERKRVAYDLHDELCQSLSAILLEIQSNTPKNATLGFVQIGLETRIRDLIDHVRQLAGQLRPSILDDYGLESALARKIKDISGLKGITIDYQSVSSVEQKERLPDAIEVSLYRVAMEALDNAISHAEASHISVIVLWQKGKVMLLVEDDGHGFDYGAVRKDLDHCKGLIEMEERIVMLGGMLRIESASERGTTVRAEVPVESIH